MILCPQPSAQDAFVLAERAWANIEALKLPHGPVTASFGVVEQNAGHSALHEVVSQADLALHQSKANGRNQVTVFVGEAVVEAA